jgi:isoleucyl-tRNA synthetase
MIPQPAHPPPDAADLDRGVRRRWRERRLSGRPEAPRDAEAPRHVLHVAALPAAGPVDAARVTLHAAVDVISRHRAMCGVRVEHVLGWDCHDPAVPADGVEQAVSAHIERDERLRRALGCDDDATRTTRTMEPTYVDSVWWAIAQLWEAGLLQEVTTAAWWCRACGRDVGEAVVTAADVASTTALVRFPVRGDTSLCTVGASVLVAVERVAALPSVDVVTTPAGSDLVLAQAAGDAYPVVVARDAVPAVLGPDATVHRGVTVDEVAGQRCRHPSTSGDVEVAVADGDGGAGTATGFAVPVAATPPAGAGRDAALLDVLRDRGLLLRVVERRRTVMQCGACGGAVVRRDGGAWAATTSRVAEQLAAERADVTRRSITGTPAPTPDDGRDWIVSRSAGHGIPLPLWRCDACHDVTAVSGRARLATLVGCEVDALDPHDGSVDTATFVCRACRDGMARRVPLMVDTRLGAGAVPFARFGFPALPGSDARVARHCHADVVVDRSGVVADAMLIVASLLWDAGSHDAVLTTGDEVTGADVDVDGLCARHGADAVRWAAVAAAADWRGAQACEDLAGAAASAIIAPLLEACTSFEKAAADAAWSPADVAGVADVATRPVWDRWILAELAETVAVVRDRLEDLDLAGAGRRIRSFVTAVGLWRSHRTADAGVTAEQDGASALATFHECLVTVAALLAPLTPFLSDELFERLVRSSEPAAPDSVHLLRYPVPHAAARDDDLRRSMHADHDHGMRLARDVIRAVNELRVHRGVDDDDHITVRIDADAQVAAAVETYRRTIADRVLATRIELGPTEDGVPVPLNDAPARLALRRAAS